MVNRSIFRREMFWDLFDSIRFCEKKTIQLLLVLDPFDLLDPSSSQNSVLVESIAYLRGLWPANVCNKTHFHNLFQNFWGNWGSILLKTSIKYWTGEIFGKKGKKEKYFESWGMVFPFPTNLFTIEGSIMGKKYHHWLGTRLHARRKQTSCLNLIMSIFRQTCSLQFSTNDECRHTHKRKTQSGREKKIEKN